MAQRTATEDAFAERLAQEIARVCAARGVPQRLIAKTAGVSETTLSSWKRGRSKPDFAHMRSLAAALGVTIEQLTGNPRAVTSSSSAHQQACERLVRQIAAIRLGAAAAAPVPALGDALQDLGSVTPDLLAALADAQAIVEAIDLGGPLP